MTPATPTPFPELLKRLEAIRLELGRHRSMWLTSRTAGQELRADMCDQLAHTMDQMLAVERSVDLLHEWTLTPEDA